MRKSLTLLNLLLYEGFLFNIFWQTNYLNTLQYKRLNYCLKSIFLSTYLLNWTSIYLFYFLSQLKCSTGEKRPPLLSAKKKRSDFFISLYLEWNLFFIFYLCVIGKELDKENHAQYLSFPKYNTKLRNSKNFLNQVAF